ncbi:2Fe-2S iron-sulfur cluster-binding protein [Haloarchaeobius litoreus]|uniref:2Fe-2S iron-sulfur cluster-binding protein n=1 Tax=Haloarchaeobius litoreus TaxID=755306 RepID=A0ABD6DIU9_9EURY|nr:2Fe-2S iron-sulfur cluster-binding protein [Haloarchaeobius litoreus]
MAPTPTLTLLWRDGSEEAVRASGESTVLEAAESAAIGLPFGCRTGACGTCAGRSVEGTVQYNRPPRALKTRHSEAGYLLCCIARPLTDCQIEVGADVRAEMVSNPWK